jgi:hypothetical protein
MNIKRIADWSSFAVYIVAYVLLCTNARHWPAWSSYVLASVVYVMGFFRGAIAERSK